MALVETQVSRSGAQPPVATTWRDVHVTAGATESVEIDIPFADISVPPGRVRGADGQKLKQDARVDFKIVESGSGCKIVLDAPAPQDLVFKVKQEEPD